MARGWSNTEIAERLYLSWPPRNPRRQPLMTLHARDRTQLVVIAYEAGLVTLVVPRAADVGAGDRVTR